jgi:hypothetical protein
VILPKFAAMRAQLAARGARRTTPGGQASLRRQLLTKPPLRRMVDALIRGGGRRSIAVPPGSVRRARLIDGIRTGISPPSNLIQNATIQRRLMDRLQIKERGPVPTVSPEVQPVIIVDDVRTPENADDVRRCMSGLAPGAVAAQFSTAMIRNPIGSGVNLHFRWAVITNGAAASVDIQIGTRANTAVTPSTATYADRRVAGTGRASVVTSNEVGFPALNGLATTRLFDGTPARIDLDGVVIPPGTELVVVPFATNSAFNVSLMYDERPVVQ